MAFGRNNEDNEEILRQEIQNQEADQQPIEAQELPEEQEVAEEPAPEPVRQAHPSQQPKEQQPNLVDGWRIINNDDLPNHGVLYPSSWRFAYRCPTAKEVINFSTVDDRDTPAIIAAIEDLVRKCVKIWDTDTEQEVSSTEINDGHKLYFILKLREFYIPNNYVILSNICSICHEEYNVELKPQSISYPEPSEKLLEAYDGRVFHLYMGDDDEPIEFRIPTIGTTSRLFKYMVRVYNDRNTKDKEKKDNKLMFDKSFLKIAPFLFVTGKEPIVEIINKFKKLKNDDVMLEKYVSIIDNIELDNATEIASICPKCDGEDTVEITFPGGWKKIFAKDFDTRGYFRN